jgi:hypothetical protein
MKFVEWKVLKSEEATKSKVMYMECISVAIISENMYHSKMVHDRIMELL